MITKLSPKPVGRIIAVLYVFAVLTSSLNAFSLQSKNPSKFWRRSSSERYAVSGPLKQVLKKPSKALSTIVEVNAPSLSVGDIDVRSMQIRKSNGSAIYTKDIETAKKLVMEQKSAQGDFPGPVPIIFEGDIEISHAIDYGISALIISQPLNYGSELSDVSVIYRIMCPEEVEEILGIDQDANAFLIEFYFMEKFEEIVDKLPDGSIIIASVESMQPENVEIELCKNLKNEKATSILMKEAIVGDNEDNEYLSFFIDGIAKKKSSNFNMTGKRNIFEYSHEDGVIGYFSEVIVSFLHLIGLTGSTNGHFGGVATTTSRTWLRKKLIESM